MTSTDAIQRTVVITGAASGIGKAATDRFAREGWRCVLVDRDGPALGRVLNEMPAPAGESHLTIESDLTSAASSLPLPEEAGPVHALINNAGMSDSSGTALTDQPYAQLERILELNLHAPARLIESLSPRLAAGARIVNVASGAALHVIPFRSTYCASKAGLLGLSRALTEQRTDLCVSTVCPGFVATDLVEELIASGRLDPVRAVAKIPLGRMGRPEEIAEALLFLAGDAAPALRGAVLCIDGGSSVFGGSTPYGPTSVPRVPLDMPADYKCAGAGCAHLARGLPRLSGGGPYYPADIDTTPMQVPPGALIEAMHAVASRFAERHDHSASLTYLLPPDGRSLGYVRRGELAAARMFVATLACELGPKGLRINALQAEAQTGFTALSAVLGYLGGPGAQYITGQTLTLGGDGLL